MKTIKILAIETSCDECCAAVVENGRKTLSGVVFSQTELHRQYGGVFPEVASRSHAEVIDGVVKKAVADAGISAGALSAVAVTVRPGLIGALLVGLSYAKGLAYRLGLPLVGVNHVEAHVAANYLGTGLEPPFLAVVLSGGHTLTLEVTGYNSYRVLGTTRDDAVGEAYDKVARILGFEYPGGALLDKLAREGETKTILPVCGVKGSPLDFSFSGVKTAVMNIVNSAKQKGEEIDRADIATAFTKSVTAAVAGGLAAAIEVSHPRTLAVAGGVAASVHMRRKITEVCERHGLNLFIPPLRLCTDNAEMAGARAYYSFIENPCGDGLFQNAYADMFEICRNNYGNSVEKAVDIV